MTDLLHAYHIWAAGDWREPVEEHYSALAKSGFDGPMIVGVVGTPAQRAEALAWINKHRRPRHVIQAEKGWEQVTLRAAHAHARKTDGFTLYAHTKGAANPSRLQQAWRRSMTCALLGGVWGDRCDALQSHVASLAIAYDLVCCHWLTAEQYPDVIADTPFPMAGGNFWLARNDFLRQLPPVPNRARHDAEAWIGLGPTPRVLDLNPGWPGTVPWITKQGWPS